MSGGRRCILSVFVALLAGTPLLAAAPSATATLCLPLLCTPKPPGSGPPPPSSAPPPAERPGSPKQPLPHCKRVRPRHTTGRLIAGQHAVLRGLTGAALCRRARLAARSGATMIREDLEWSVLEPERGVYRWDLSDRIFAAAAQSGLRVLPIIDEVPAWAGDDQSALPSDPATYAAFVAKVVDRYGPHGRFWRHHRSQVPGRAPTWFELWNEPFYGAFSAGHPDAGRYARLVRASVRAGRKADRTARFLVASELTSDRDPPEQWMSAMYAAVPHFSHYVDGFAVHPYSLLPPDLYTPGKSRRQTRRVEDIRRFADRHGGSHKPIWITEIGWPTCSDLDSCVTEQTQASDVDAVFRLARTRWKRYVRAVFLYALVDSGVRAAGREADFGVVHPGGSAKPAFRAFQRDALHG